MRALLKHPLVDCDLEEAALWYSRDDPKVAERLIEACRTAMLTAAADPFRFPIRFEDVRRIRVSGFPHGVYFTVEQDSITVLAIIHGARDVERVLEGRQRLGG
jgi:toxin ParE1/3/4